MTSHNLGTPPDFRDWILMDDPTDHMEATLKMREVNVEHAGRGAQWPRFTIVDAHGLRYICVEGWRTRPEIEAPPPTASHAPVGFA